MVGREWLFRLKEKGPHDTPEAWCKYKLHFLPNTPISFLPLPQKNLPTSAPQVPGQNRHSFIAITTEPLSDSTWAFCSSRCIEALQL